ncbi:hypothetical protein ACWD26_36560 [Streptomyces sp. NPDC002787]
MATKPKTTQEPPVELPIGLNAWLLDCVPVADCETCQCEWRKLNGWKRRGDIAQAARAASNVRGHAGGGHS